jgi:hypothetical protein
MTGQERARVARDSGSARIYKRRRTALEAFMLRHDLKPAEWARSAGLSTANSLYNFINGHSRTLSQETLERLASAVPGATVTEIIGETPATGVKAATVAVRVGAGAGMWRASYEADIAPPQFVALPPGVAADEAAIILDGHVDEVYPAGSYVGVQAFASLGRALRDGDRVLVHRIRGGRHEVTVRELRVEKAGDAERAVLVFRSAAPAHGIRIEVPWPYRGEVWQVDGDTLQIRGRIALMVLLSETD